MASETRDRSRTRRRVHLVREAQQVTPKEACGAAKRSREALVRFNRRAVVALLPWWTNTERSKTFTSIGQLSSALSQLYALTKAR